MARAPPLTHTSSHASSLRPRACLQLYGTCLGFEMLHILASNVTREDLMFETVGQDASIIFGRQGARARGWARRPREGQADARLAGQAAMRLGCL